MPIQYLAEVLKILLNYIDILTVISKSFSSTSQGSYDHPIIHGNSIAWVKFDIYVEETITNFCLSKSTTVELRVRRTFFWFRNREDFIQAVEEAMRLRNANQRS